MDIRNTLAINGDFCDILVDCQEHGSKIALLLDENGIVRKEGFIKEMVWDDPVPFIELKDGAKIELATILAVNGVFVPSYSEC
ncbi:hypothetical protein [Niabella hibiscisoli]|uniref:hypothetical protein n=1 Tax=Niabella hibiscisoli TaxID=1825928 RepID=UPI001F0EA87D|nr:hypothetical protein [Niabella hibiscisoli]MCH5718233.1 hypothetical protein [Niabella hibiscisoli]